MLLPHNQKLFSDIVHELDDNNVHSLLYVQGTGVGKSYIFFELVNSRFSGCKVLYVVPKHAVRENLVLYDVFKSLPAKITFITYDVFNKHVARKYSKYDAVFFDEAHHIEADSYQRLIKLFDPEYLIGLTAIKRFR